MTPDAPWLLIDQGNTAIKWRMSDASGLRPEGGVVESVEALRADLAAFDWGAVGLSSVGSDETRSALTEMLSAMRAATVFTASSERACLGLRNSYADPERMGVDRWLAMLAARDALEGAFCVIDAGTAVTVDIVAADGQHEGGYILPGPELMRRALMSDTGRIRAEAGVAPDLAPGQSTTDCVNAGVWRAACAGVQSVMADHPEHRVIVTGGGAAGLLTLGVTADFRPDLVLQGLWVWLSKALDDQSA